MRKQPLPCEERNWLEGIYLSAVVKRTQPSPGVTPQERVAAILASDQACTDALVALDRHKTEHGC